MITGMTTNTPTPIYDQTCADLGFSLEDLGLPPVKLSTKRERHKARRATLRTQEAVLAAATSNNVVAQ